MTNPEASTGHVETSSRAGLETNAALVVVAIGLFALTALGIAAMVLADEGDMGTIATASFGVIGSIVGAFFGVHAGLGDRQRIEEGHRNEAAKSAILLGMLPDDKVGEAMKRLRETSES